MIYEIINVLPDKAYGEFLQSTAPRSRSRKLTSVLRGPAKEPDKDLLFTKVFRQKRNKSNDHLLRNEISILKRKLEDYITRNTVTQISPYSSCSRSYIMAQWCLRHSLTAHCEKYALQAREEAMTGEDWISLLKINKLLVQCVNYDKTHFDQRLKRLSELEHNHRYYLQQIAAEETMYADFVNASAYKTSLSLRKLDTVFEPTITLSYSFTSVNGRLAAYYFHRSRAYGTAGPQTMHHLEKALECLSLPAETAGMVEEELGCLGAMAVEYSLMGDFEKAEQIFARIIAHNRFETFIPRHAILLNYCTTLLKLKKYKTALQYLQKLEKETSEPVITERIFSMKCNCYILSENLQGIRDILPTDLNQYDLSVKIYYRLLYVIYYLIKNDHELAQREIVNMMKAKDMNKTPYLPLVKIFDTYISTAASHYYRENNAERKIRNFLQAFSRFGEENPALVNMLPAMWIKEKGDAMYAGKTR